MAKSGTKKHIGRLQSYQLVIRLPKQVLHIIDKLACDQATGRSEIMRQLMTEALAARKRV